MPKKAIADKPKPFNRETATLFEMFDHFCGCINFGHSALDADGVYCMNQLFILLRKQCPSVIKKEEAHNQ